MSCITAGRWQQGGEVDRLCGRRYSRVLCKGTSGTRDSNTHKHTNTLTHARTRTHTHTHVHREGCGEGHTEHMRGRRNRRLGYVPLRFLSCSQVVILSYCPAAKSPLILRSRFTLPSPLGYHLLGHVMARQGGDTVSGSGFLGRARLEVVRHQGSPMHVRPR